jgi:hypothetical protein
MTPNYINANSPKTVREFLQATEPNLLQKLKSVLKKLLKK